MCLFGKMPPFLPWLHSTVAPTSSWSSGTNSSASSWVPGWMLCLWTDLNLRSRLIPSLQLCLRLMDVLLDGFWTLFSTLLCCHLCHPPRILLLSVPRRGLLSVYFLLSLFGGILPEQFVVKGSAPPFLLGGVRGGTMSARFLYPP